MATFEFNADQYFAGMRQAGLNITAEQEATARRVIASENTSGDIYTMLVNALVSAFRAVSIFFGGSSDNSSLGDRLSAAMENGQQRGDMHTAAEVAHRIRNKLLANGFPADLAAAMTGDTTTQPEVQGNLYRVFSNSRNITPENRAAEREYQQSQDPQLAAIAPTTRFPVAEASTVSAPSLPASGNRSLTGNTPAA